MKRALLFFFSAMVFSAMPAQHSTEDAFHRQIREDRERRDAYHEQRRQRARAAAAEARAAEAEGVAQDALDRVDALYEIEARRQAEAAARAAAEAKAKEERERERYRAELELKRERFYEENRAAAKRRSAAGHTTSSVGSSEAGPAISYLIRERDDGSYLVKVSHRDIRIFENEELACAYIDGALGLPMGTTLTTRRSTRAK